MTKYWFVFLLGIMLIPRQGNAVVEPGCFGQLNGPEAGTGKYWCTVLCKYANGNLVTFDYLPGSTIKQCHALAKQYEQIFQEQINPPTPGTGPIDRYIPEPDGGWVYAPIV
jgi:hypothetical protein